jgi:hypothetical protein
MGMKKLLTDLGVVVSVFITLAMLSYIVDVWLAKLGVNLETTLLNDLLLPAIAAAITFALLREKRHKEAILEARLRALDDAFDHIRNALQIVVNSSEDEPTRAAVLRLSSAMGSMPRDFGRRDDQTSTSNVLEWPKANIPKDATEIVRDRGGTITGYVADGKLQRLERA